MSVPRWNLEGEPQIMLLLFSSSFMIKNGWTAMHSGMFCTEHCVIFKHLSFRTLTCFHSWSMSVGSSGGPWRQFSPNRSRPRVRFPLRVSCPYLNRLWYCNPSQSVLCKWTGIYERSFLEINNKCKQALQINLTSLLLARKNQTASHLDDFPWLYSLPHGQVSQAHSGCTSCMIGNRMSRYTIYSFKNLVNHVIPCVHLGAYILS